MPTNTYAINKYLVWGVVFWFIAWPTYNVYDWLSHKNWPPADPRNHAFFTKLVTDLGCDKLPAATVTQEMLDGDTSGRSFRPVGFDRKAFFDAPGCIGAGIYVLKEGTGIRDQFDVFDMTTKQRTARFIITHESFNQP